MSKHSKIFIAIAGLAFSSGVLAQSTGMAVTADYSVPFGLGIAGSYSFMPKTLNARLAYHPSQKLMNKDDTKDGFNVHATAKFGYLGAFADWFPFDGDFRMSGGLASMTGTKITADGSKLSTKSFTSISNASTATFQYENKTYSVNIGESYRYNGTTYYIRNNNGVPFLSTTNDDTFNGADISLSDTAVNNATANLKAQATIKFKNVAPYLGMGYGNPVNATGGWSFFADVGLFFTGKPNIEVTIANNCAASADATACDVLRQELQKQSDKTIQEVRDDLNKIKILPNLAIGMSYSF